MFSSCISNWTRILKRNRLKTTSKYVLKIDGVVYMTSTDASGLIIFKYLSFTWPLSTLTGERCRRKTIFREKEPRSSEETRRCTMVNRRHVTVGIFWSTKFFWFADIQIFKPGSTTCSRIDKLSRCPSSEKRGGARKRFLVAEVAK